MTTTTETLFLCTLVFAATSSEALFRKEGGQAILPSSPSTINLGAATSESVSIFTSVDRAGHPDVVESGVFKEGFESAIRLERTTTELYFSAGRETKISLKRADSIGEGEENTIACDPFLNVTRVVDAGSSNDANMWKISVRYRCERTGLCPLTLKIDAVPRSFDLPLEKRCGMKVNDGISVGSVPENSDIARAGVLSETGDFVLDVNSEEVQTKMFLRNDREDGAAIYFQAPNVSVVSGPRQANNAPGLMVHLNQKYHNGATPNYVGRSAVTNIALNKKEVSASSALCGHYPEQAVDGVVDGHDKPEHYVAMTGRHGEDPQPFWQIDLGGDDAKKVVKEIRVYNRVDVLEDGFDFSKRLPPFWILLFGSFEGKDEYGHDLGPPRSLEDAKAQAIRMIRFSDVQDVYTWSLRVGAHVRWLRVQKEEENFLQIAEVEIYAADEAYLCDESSLEPFVPAEDGEDSDQSDVDPVCYEVSADVTAEPPELSVDYTCLWEGEYEVEATIPWFPRLEPFAPTTMRWTKSCTATPHPSLQVELVSSTAARIVVAQPFPKNPVVDGVVVTRRVEVGEHFRFQHPTYEVPGHVQESVFELKLDAVGTQSVGAPILTGKGDRVASPEIGGDLSRGGTLDTVDQNFRLAWHCNRAGIAKAQISLVLTPYLQPYAGVSFGLLKKCGGARRTGFAVNVISDDDSADTLQIVEDGALKTTSSTISTTAFDGSEAMSLRVRLPLADNATASLSSSVSSLESAFVRNFEQLDVSVDCEPSICHSSYWGDKPKITIEQSSSAGAGPRDGVVKIEHYCSKSGPAVVEVNMTVGFYDTYTFRYDIECTKSWYVNLIPWLW